MSDCLCVSVCVWQQNAFTCSAIILPAQVGCLKEIAGIEGYRVLSNLGQRNFQKGSNVRHQVEGTEWPMVIRPRRVILKAVSFSRSGGSAG